MAFLQRQMNRGSVSTGYDVDNSALFEADDSSYIRFTNISTYASSARKKKFSMSMWFKLAEVGKQQVLFSTAANGYLLIQATGVMKWQQTYSSVQKTLNTNRVFRDTGAWYHVLIVVDTAQSTEADRTKLYVNNEQITDFSSATYPSQNDEAQNVYEQHNYIGTWGGGDHVNTGLSGYVSEFYFLSEIAASPTDFGEYDEDSGIWKPKAYTAETITSPSSYLNFSNASNLAEATSGQDWASGNVQNVGQATDTCTNNFCTLNPLVNFKYTTNGITDGGTVFGDNTGGGVGGAFGTMAVTTGKWYWEVKLVDQVSHYIGVSAVDDGDNVLASSDPHQINSTFNFNIGAARIEYINGGTVTHGSLDAFSDFHTNGDIIGIALNMDDNQISIYGNGTLQSGVANTSLYDAANKMVVPFHATINDECQYNFGGYSAWTPSSAASDANGYGNFEYAPPSGYYALCGKNLAEFGGTA